MPAYKSYCWSLGTTSFRMVEFNRKIEKQLAYLDEFWRNPEFATQKWSENEPLQEAYYNFLKAQEFIVGDAPRKAKDAREKTSGLVDLGLIDDERRLTDAGKALLKIATEQDFNRENLLQIPADSFLYFRQLLKVSCSLDGAFARPYLILAMALNRLGELSDEEFTYLLPLAISQTKTEYILNAIEKIRRGESTVDETIIAVLMDLPNYREAYSTFLQAQLSEELIMEIGMNRKSKSYDKPYYDLYVALSDVLQTHSDESAVKLFRAVKSLSGKGATLWKQYLFATTNTKAVERDGYSALNIGQRIFDCHTEAELRLEFFKLLHLFKAKSLLSDYFDLNRRYFKTTDTVLFQDNKVKFDIIPNCFFHLLTERLPEMAYNEEPSLTADIELPAIIGVAISQEEIFAKVEALYGVQVRNLYDVQAFVDRERYDRFNRMVDEMFTDEKLISLMTLFEERRDSEIQAMVTNNADVPTIFEYVLAVAWYKISGRQGKVLEYMNLSLDADLLPITHAAGGHEDITYHYEATEAYPAHTLLIEATLAGGTNQRRMEMEPVSRHLGDYLLSHRGEEAYCLFATTYLHINVISDFRMRKHSQYYSSDGSEVIDGMKIIPCQTSEIKTIIERGITYRRIYKIFEDAYHANTEPNKWYKEKIIDGITEL